jgi:hypothetical protein
LTVRADVEVKNKNQIKFSGFMGKMFGMFGGKAAKEGVVTTEVVAGNRKLSRSEDVGDIIDLDEEKIYQVDWKKKRYEVMTFDEMREQMKKAADQMKGMSGESKEEPRGTEEEPAWEVDVKLEKTGNTRNINGFDTREVVMTITSRQKGKTLEEGGGMVMTSNVWLTDKVPGAGEINEFNRRYAEKLFGTAAASADQQMAAMAAIYPGMQSLLGKFRDEEVNMDGTPVLTTMTVEAVASKEDAEKVKQQEEEAPTSIGGMFGGLSKKFGKKEKSDDKGEAKTPGRSTVMTLNGELLSVTTSVSADAVAIPAGFKEK